MYLPLIHTCTCKSENLLCDCNFPLGGHTVVVVEGRRRGRRVDGRRRRGGEGGGGR